MATGAYRDRGRRGARRRVGEPAVRPRRHAVDGRSRRSGEAIAERLGWLDAPARIHRQRSPPSKASATRIVDAGFTTAVVAGMGGSSLAPDVLHRTFGSQRGLPRPAHPRLDRSRGRQRRCSTTSIRCGPSSSSPASRARRSSRTRSSPTPGTAPSTALDKVHHHAYETPGATIVAITDPGKSLEAIPHHDEFREVFLNPPDIGGRYSALTYVGLVPASLIGLDLDALLASATAMLGACREPDPDANPGRVARASPWARWRKAGRDKLTFLRRRRDRRRSGRGPSSSSPRAPASTASGSCRSTSSRSARRRPTATDRVFVRLAARRRHGRRPRRARRCRSRRPVTRSSASTIADPIDLGGEFVRWEVATAIAGAVLGIDPFDQPNVEEAKQLTRDVLAAAERGERG